MEVSKKSIIYQGNSLISIETLPDYPDPVIIKKPSEKHSSPRNVLSLEKEYEMTRALDEIEGVRQVLEKKTFENQPELILEYIDGETLRDYIQGQSSDLKSRLEIAVELTRILEKIHQTNIIHLDLNSKNIIIEKETQTVNLIDLGSASLVDGTGSQKVRPDQMLGTLSYISPEQTGRINRAVDDRSDLYSLGVVLYELFTGKLPFESKNPAEIIYQHITRIPLSPSELKPETPQVICDIILKLLSKNADDRYQSAAGVRTDLERCLQNLKPDNCIEVFPLGEADYSSRFKFPQKLYGRENELKELVNAFNKACIEAPSLFFVGGYSGIGKTALVEEIQRPVSEKSGYFIQGKFDQLATTPYAGIAQALAQFVSQILTQTETQLAAWRSKILEAVGPNGRVLTDIVPSLELVIDPQPAVPDLSGQEAQNRFNYVFRRFFGAIAYSEHPICFFLDDLQWIDPGSLGLLKNLFSSPDLAHLLVIGAYRDNEVHEDHPLMTLIADLEKAGVNLRQMTLQKLSEADIEALISDTLQSNHDEIRELAWLVYSKTNGNPFFTRQVLRSMKDQGLIALDTATGHWRLDMDALRDLDVIDSVVELLVGKLKELSVDIQEMLKVAACIGNQFDITTLKVVTEGDDDAILDHVHEAVTAGLILERDDRCSFVHDRVQEAAYALVPIEERDRLHLTIGRLLLQRHRASDHGLDLFRIVDQLNHGLHMVEDDQERIQLARLNLQATRTARQTTAFETGLNYAQAGIELLGETGWEQHYRLTLELHEQAALMAYSAGDIPGMKHHSAQVLQFGRDPLELARVQRMRIEFLLSSKRFDEAIDLGLEALRILGEGFPAEPTWEEAIARLNELLEREPPDFLSIPPLQDQDPHLAAVGEITLPLANAAYISRPTLSPLLIIRCLELSLERQLLPPCTPFLLAVMGGFVNGLLGKVEAAHAYGKIAVELSSRSSFRGYMASALHLHGVFLHFWRKHLRETLDLFLQSIRIGHDFGDNEYVAYSSYAWSMHSLFVSTKLARVEEQSLEHRTFLDAIGFDTQRRYVELYMTAAQALRGNSSARGTCWRGTPFDDDRDLSGLHEAGDTLGLFFAHCAKAWVATLFDDRGGVEKHSDLASSHMEAGNSMMMGSVMLHFVRGLRRARELRDAPEGVDGDPVLHEHLDLLERYAGLAPMNFAHKLALVQAEVHRARGEVFEAMQAYEKASHGAKENGYLNEAGLAHALAAEFYQDLGLHQAALHNAKQAAQAWRSWGAHALVESLSQRLPDLLGPSDLSWQSASDTGKLQTTITRPISPIQMDMESIISASQLLSAETNIEQLLNKMMNLVMSNSSAEKAVLLIKEGEDWYLEARSDIEKENSSVLLNQYFDPASEKNELIPEAVFNYCCRAKEVLVVGDAMRDNRFVKDRLIQSDNIKSLACIPVSSHGILKALLYLDNSKLADVFTLERVEILKHLSSQFGISVENAMLYNSLEQKVDELHKSEDHFRQLMDQSPMGMEILSPDGKIIRLNSAWKKLWNVSEEEAAETLDKYNMLTDPQLERLGIMDEVKEAFKGKHTILPPIRYDTGQTKDDFDLQVLKELKSPWIQCHLYPIKDEDGKLINIINTYIDITFQKTAEEELRKAFNEIEQLKNQLEAESAYLQDEIKLTHNFENIIGESDALKYVLRRVEQVAPTESPVLIMGETGTGKELMARAVHDLSQRSRRALIKINCAALPRELIESELFGHEKGAFTGAASSRQGRFEVANGSTLFLDEIGELPLELQAKLLRVLESGEYERLGSSKTLHSNARIIVATNRVLEEEVIKGHFREDLWYRLKVFPITVPPLRERSADIPLLVRWIVDRQSRKMGKSVSEISKAKMEKLQSYPWPGNVRELQHAVESALITAAKGKLNFDLPIIKEKAPGEFKSFEDMERNYILQVLKAHNWKIGGENSAASVLGIHVNTLRSRMLKLGISKPKPE